MMNVPLTERVRVLERDVARHEVEIVTVEADITALKIAVATIGVRLSIYATLGAAVGGIGAALLSKLTFG